MNTQIYTPFFVLMFLCVLYSNPIVAQYSFSEILQQEQAVGPDGLSRCSSVEIDFVRHLNNPNLPSIKEFETWLAPKVAAHKQAKGDNINGVLQIPVVVHVLHNGEDVGTAPNITDAQVLSQIQVLNEDFLRIGGSPGDNSHPDGADMQIEFVLAKMAPDGSATNGINRRNINQDGVTTDGLENTIKAATIWEPTEYLNVWSVKFVAPDDGILGYAQVPEGSGQAGLPTSGEEASTDGVVIRYQSFGSSAADDGTFLLDAPYDLGRTATHEVGHWIGLRHIWGDVLGCNMGVPAAGCSCSEDDYCDDTPNSDMANYGCPDGKTSPCDQLEDPLVDPTLDMIENYMDYTDDVCMNIFTNDQKARAQAVMFNSPRRMELPTSPALFPPTSFVSFSRSESAIREGSSCNEQQINIELSLSQASSTDVTLSIELLDFTADNNDYSVDSWLVTIPEGNTSANFSLTVNEDAEIENNEQLTFEISSVNGDAEIALTNQTHIFTIADDDYSPLLAGTQPNVTLYTENFSSDLGSWTQSDFPGTNVEWKSGSPVNGMPQSAFVSRTDLPASNPYAYDALADAVLDLISPTIDVSQARNLTLSFDYICFGEQDAASGDLFDYGSVLISCDNGQNWQQVGQEMVNESSATSQTIALPAIADNCAQLQIAFRWQNDALVGFDPPLSVDNIRIRGDVQAPVSVSTTVNSSSPSELNLSPHTTIYFYDDNDGRLLLSLENDSDFDYGCTSVAIDRSRTSANADAVPFWNNDTNNALAAKTFRIQSANTPTSSAAVVATVYYGQAEIISWENATGQVRTALQTIQVANNSIGAVTTTNFSDFDISIFNPVQSTFNTSNVTLSTTLTNGLNIGLGTGIAGVALPVEWLSFSAYPAENKDVSLQWKTASEESNDYFEIQFSHDGRAFTTLNQIAGKGDTDTESAYTFIHKQAPAGNNYYRLAQYDYDGSFSYSPIRQVNIKNSNTPIQLYPNPVTDQLHIALPEGGNDHSEIHLIDANGQKIRQYQSSNQTHITIDTQDLRSGSYFIRLINGKDSEVHTISIIH